MLPDNFNSRVDSKFDCFGSVNNMDDKQFREEVFLIKNILTRPSGPTTSPINATKTKKTMTSSQSLGNLQRKASQLLKDGVENLPKKEVIVPDSKKKLNKNKNY